MTFIYSKLIKVVSGSMIFWDNLECIITIVIITDNLCCNGGAYGDFGSVFEQYVICFIILNCFLNVCNSTFVKIYNIVISVFCDSNRRIRYHSDCTVLRFRLGRNSNNSILHILIICCGNIESNRNFCSRISIEIIVQSCKINCTVSIGCGSF